MARAVHILIVVVLAGTVVFAQTKPRPRQPARKPPAPAFEKAPAQVFCPSVLGSGVSTKRMFCDVLIGRDPGDGVLIRIPPHKGDATLTFDLHNRQTVSEEQVKTRTAYTRSTATIGVLTLDNTLVSRAVVMTEFRTLADLFDRIAGGAGPAGVKAVAPVGSEPVSMSLPEGVTEVSILGEKLSVVRGDGSETFVAAGRPMAIISNVMTEFRAAPAPKGRTR